MIACSEEINHSPPDGSKKWADWEHGERHKFFVKQLESAFGRALPQIEIRVEHLSIGADLNIRPDTTPELPTLWNVVKQRLMMLLCVKRQAYHKRILSDFNGVFRPGTMTLLLGQPGSGKSTLMKYLSGRFETTKNMQLTGTVTYNGVEHSKLRKQMPQFASYVTQSDKHFPTLTVKETFDFAHAFCDSNIVKQTASRISNGTDEQNNTAREILQYVATHMPELVINQLGLGNCQDTIVGNAMLRGVSGGERKRVTMGEMQFGLKNVYLMDEISTGLDSASTYDIIKYQSSLARTMSRTVMIALLQPPPQVFDLFDNLILLNDSHVMYQGPRVEAIEYFEKLGFRSPPHRDPADFLLDLGTQQQREYELHDGVPRTPAQFAELFEESEYYKKITSDLNAPVSEHLARVAKEDMSKMPEFQQTFRENLVTLIRRQWMLTFRNKAFLRGRSVMVIMMALIYGSAYIHLDPAAIQLVMGFLFSGLLFLALGQATQIATYTASREIFYKQRDANFYRTSAFVLSNSASQFPLALLESIVFGTVFYWMGGLFPSARDFILFLVILFLANMAFAAWFFFLSMAAPNLSIAKPLSMVSILIFILFAGFVILRNSMPKYLIWLYWLNPIAWALRGLAVLQYSDASFHVCVYSGIDYCTLYGRNFSEYSLELFDVPKDTFWIYWAIAFLLVVYAGFMWFSWVCLEYVRVPEPINIRLEVDKKEHVELDVYQVAQTPKAQPSGSADHSGGSGSEKHFIPVSLVFRNLWYTVPDPKRPKEWLDLLKGVSGFALPGTMTALMGSSGAGKTTLMDVIAGRKTGGRIKGEILLNGHVATDLAIRRATGYCEQMDIHSEASTFREALTFSTMLRQKASIPKNKKLDSVAECLDLLNLNPIADQIIRGSSMEEMKRLTIGVELAAQPSVLFLDEPTSGLDARSAKLIMDGVRKVADSGRTVVCTIHQPSYEVFSIFDNLLLLKRGGETVYFGPLGDSCRDLIEYFEAIPGIPPITEGYNPATWMLECIGAGVGHDVHNQSGIVEEFKTSELKKLMDVELDKAAIRTSGQVLQYSSHQASNQWTQCVYVTHRFLVLYWRTPSYNLTRIIVFIILALLFGLIFVSSNYRTYQQVNSALGMLYMATVFAGVVSFNSVLPIAISERNSFYRERASQTYSAVWYFVGSTVAEIPHVLFSTLVFTLIFYPMVGLQGFASGVVFWLAVACHVLLSSYIGQFFAYALPSVAVAALLGTLFNTICFLFMGFSPPGNSVPSGYRWLYHIVPYRYALSIVVSTVFGKCKKPSDFGCQIVENTPPVLGTITAKEYVQEVFNMSYENVGAYFGYLIIFIGIFRLFALLALQFINHQKR
ncbi:hypothetical protein ABG067_005522 [Albugo candida]